MKLVSKSASISLSFILGLLFGLQAVAASDRLVSRGLSEINAAQDQVQQLIRVRQTPEVAERLRYIQERLFSAETLLEDSLRQGDRDDRYPYPPSSPITPFTLYRSDYCNGEVIGTVNSSTSCEGAYTNAPQTWGVKIDGQCLNTYDMPSTLACRSLRGIGKPTSLKIYKSDYCSGDLIAAVSEEMSCEDLKSFSGNIAWGVQRGNGPCENISDIAVVDACHRFR